MFPLLSIIVALGLGLSYRELIVRPEPPDLVLGALFLVGYAIAAWIVSVLAVRGAMRGPEPDSGRVRRAGAALRLATVVVYGLIVYDAHWPGVVDRLGIGGWVLVDDLVTLLPYVLLLAVSLTAAWWAESRLGLHEFRCGAYLSFQLRQYLLPVTPVLFFILVIDLVQAGAREGIEWVATLWIRYESYPFFQWLVIATLLLLLYCLIPFVLRLLWGARSMPPGPVRTRLTEFAAREGFRARDILVWPTGGNVMNAAVIGVAGPVRYVLMTDALLDALDDEEVEAVFAHEVGHAKHHHLLLFFFFTVGYLLLVYLLGNLLEGTMPTQRPMSLTESISWFLLLGIGGFLAWFGILFGFLSRRFEQQADVYGAESLGRVRGEGGGDPDSHPFVRALEGLAVQMGDIREVKGWRHFSIRDRVSFLAGFLTDPEVRRSYRRKIRQLLLFFFGLLAAIGIAAAATVPEQIEKGKLAAAALRASWLAEQGRTEEAIWETLETAPPPADGNVLPAVPTLYGNRPATATEVLAFYEQPGIPPHIRVHYTADLARRLVARGEISAARAVISAEIRRTGELGFLLLHLADLLEREGRREDARMAWRAALTRLPDGARYAAARRARAEVEKRLDKPPG